MEISDKELKTEIVKEVAKQIPLKDIYDGIAKDSVDSSGQLLALIPRAINAALSPLHKWILHKEYSIAETKALLEIKLKNVNPDNIVPPEPYIAVPLIQSLSYCQDNIELRNMYANLLASSMNKDTKNNVHPSFTEIIKQLSPDEAKILQYIFKVRSEPFISLNRQTIGQEGYITIFDYFTHIGKKSMCEMENNVPSYLENLNRLKLLDLMFDGWLTANGVYDELENDEEIVKYTSIKDDLKFKYEIDRRYMKITNYGYIFCKMCLD